MSGIISSTSNTYHHHHHGYTSQASSSSFRYTILLGSIFLFILFSNSEQQHTLFPFLRSSDKSHLTNPPTPSPVPPSCTCDSAAKHYLSVRPCSGLVNQQYTIAHGALLAAYLGVDLYIEDTGTRTSFQDADYKDSKRLPAKEFYNVPIIINEPNIKVNIVGELSPYLQKCTFPEDSFYRRKANLDSSLLYLYDKLDISCGIRIDCAFWGVKIHNEEERQNLITVLKYLQPNIPISKMINHIMNNLEKATKTSIGSLDLPDMDSKSIGKKYYAAIHLRIEPDMNQGKALPVPQDDVLRQLQALNIPKGIAIYVASGIAEEIMDQLPEGYQWFNRYTLLSSQAELNTIAKSMMAEQLALVDLVICESAAYFIGDVRSTFSIASAVVHQMSNVGWYYGSLSMWADNAPLLGLPR